MIAITSHRPFAQCSPEIKRNQLRARESWEGAFERIIYFGPIEPELDGDNVEFEASGTKPLIRRLCQKCAFFPGWSCIINADVVLGPNWKRVEPELRRYNVDCAMSRRYQFEPGGTLEDARIVDYGLDFFTAQSKVWQAAAERVPRDFALGRILWDTWMLSFFMDYSRGNCADLSPARVIFHPKHGSREDQHVTPPKDRLLERVIWPGFQIGKDWTLRPLPHFKTGAGGGGILKL